MPGGESAQPGACTPGQGGAKGGTQGRYLQEWRRGSTGPQASLGQTLRGVKPPGLLRAGWGGGRWQLLPPPTQPPSLTTHLNASGQAQHLQSLENHAPFPKGKAKCKSLPQTRICSSAARKVVKALISELGGRDNDTSAAPRAQRKKTSILGLHQRPPRFLPPWL